MPKGTHRRNHLSARPAGISQTEGIHDPGRRAVQMIAADAMCGWQPEDLTARAALIQDAHSEDHETSYKAQRTLILEYDLVLPILASRLPRELRDRLTNLRPLGPVQPTRCLSCGGALTEGRCEGRYILAQQDGKGTLKWHRCQAVWRAP